MLKGRGSEVEETEITDIQIGRAADALFFLHTFHPSSPVAGWQRSYDQAIARDRTPPDPPVVFQYVVHYDDGRKDLVPVVWRSGVGNWVSQAPAALPSAAVGWTGALTDTEQAVVYSMQWNNPRPDVPIRSINIVSGDDGSKWGSPAVFAITTARATD